MAAKNDGRWRILEPHGSHLKKMSIRWFTIAGEGKSGFHPAMSTSRDGLGLDLTGYELLLIGLDPGVLPVPVVMSETFGKTMTPGLSSGEALNNEDTAGVWTFGVVDGPGTEPVSRS